LKFDESRAVAELWFGVVDILRGVVSVSGDFGVEICGAEIFGASVRTGVRMESSADQEVTLLDQ
jgi:hypothetical protein